ncbi:MAG: hypothetical protein K1X86_15410 [Ignavibacteria bacterium]|nr:hypothetical protein [Ignavibacteria bacterium]
MSSVGEVNIPVGFDLSKFRQQLDEMIKFVVQSAEKMKNTLDFKAEGIDNNKAKENFRGISEEAQKADNSIRGMGDAGKDSIKELLRFEIVKQAVEGVKEAFSRVKEFVMGFVQDFADADLAVQKLTGGLERIGQQGWFDTLLKQASELSKITPFDDDDISNMQAMLTTFDGISAEAIQKLTPAMLNLASAFAQGGDTGMSLTQVAMLIGKSAGAELWSTLKRVGIVMTEVQQKMLETTSGMERVNVFLEIMAQNGNITAEAFGKTLAGQLQIAKNEIKNISESFGQALAPAALMIIGYVKTFAENLQKLPDAVKIAIVGIGALVIAVSSLIAVFTVLNIETAGVLIALGAIVTGLTAMVTWVIINIDKINDYISSHENLRRTIENVKGNIDHIVNSFDKLYKKIGDIIGGTEQFDKAVKRFIDANLFALATLIGAVVNAIDTFVSTMVLAAKGFETVKNAIAYSVGVVVSVIESGFNSIKNMINTVLGLFNLKISSTLTDSIGSLVDWAANKVKGLTDALRDLLGISRDANTAKVQQEAMAGTTATTWKAGDYLPKTTSNTKNDGGKKGKDEDPYKEETKNLKELMKEQEEEIKIIEKKIQLNEATPIQLLEQIRLYKQVLMEIQTGLEKEQNKKDVDAKILDLRIDENKILNLNNEAVKDAIELAKKLIDDDNKKFAEKMERQGKAYDELRQKRINNETNVLQRQVLAVNYKWDLEDQRINTTYKDIDIKEQLLKENKIARMRELSELEMNDTGSILNWTVQGFNAVQNEIGNGFHKMWEDVFGHANSLFEIFMQKVFEAFMQFAATAVFKLIMAVLNPGGAVVSAAAPASTFSEGGFTGTGGNDEPAGIVHKNEFVVSSKGVTPETRPILERLNRGEKINSFIADTIRERRIVYPASGDMSQTAKGDTINLNINVEGVSVVQKNLLPARRADLIAAIDNQLLPEISSSLHRAGKKFLDDTIKPK